MKKILSLVLVIAMMASLVVFAAPAASADETVYTVEVTDATAVAGDKVSVDVMVTGTTMYMFGFAIEYDTTRLANPVIKTNTELFGAGGAIAGADYQKSWTSNANDVNNGVDVSEATKVLTITFDVLNNPGDAYVKCAPFKNDSKIYIGETDTKATGAKYDWTAIDGKVSILPEGYEAAEPATEMPASDLEYEENAAGTGMIITGYIGSATGTAIIPAEIDGLPVVEIGATAFNYAEFDTYIFPSSVVTFGRRAVRQDAGFAVYIEADNASFDKEHYQSFVSNDGDVAVYSSASSTAKTYVEDVLADDDTVAISWAAGDYVAPPIVTVVAGSEENTYVVSGDQIAAPGAAIVDGKPVVAWKVNGAAVLPGAAVAINGDTTFTAMTVDMATANGASVKIAESADDVALRFTATINMNDYAAIVEAFDGATISHGMLIVPQQYVAKAGGFTHAALEAYGKGYLDFSNMKGCYEIVGSDYVLAASIKDFKAATRAKNPKFNAVGYIAITIGEETTYVYSNYSTATARDAKSVLTSYLNDATGDAKTWVETVLGDFS